MDLDQDIEKLIEQSDKWLRSTFQKIQFCKICEIPPFGDFDGRERAGVTLQCRLWKNMLL